MNRWNLSLDHFPSPSTIISFYMGYMIFWRLTSCWIVWQVCYFFFVFSPSVKGGYLCSGSQFIIWSGLSSVWMLSADFMSFLWSSSFQMHWEAWVLLGDDKQKQNWTIKKSHHFHYSTAAYFKINLWNVTVGCYNILGIWLKIYFIWRTGFSQIGAAQGQLFFFSKQQTKFSVIRLHLW